jgi:hypothetical protein
METIAATTFTAPDAPPRGRALLQPDEAPA